MLKVGGHTFYLMTEPFAKGLIKLFISGVRCATVSLSTMPGTQERYSKYLLSDLHSL